jgi:hypothetical protein
MRARMPTRSVDTAVPKRDAVATNPISTELKGVDAVPSIHDSVRRLAPKFTGCCASWFSPRHDRYQYRPTEPRMTLFSGDVTNGLCAPRFVMGFRQRPEIDVHVEGRR